MPQQAQKPLEAYKRDAARLLKAARANDATALGRFTHLDNLPPEPQLKHALAVVAGEAGFDGWAALKQNADAFDFSEFFTAPGLKDSINHWFRNYDEAKAHQNAHGGMLLPYRDQAFVTSFDILPRLGYEVGHPDWVDIGHDFVKPASIEAHDRIKAALTRRFAAKS